MRKALSILILCLIPCMCYSADKWTKSDIILEGLVLIPKYIDYKQTYWGAENGYKESMPFMFDDYPSKHRINCYFATTALLHIGIVHFLPQKYRKLVQIPHTTISIRNISYNKKNGISISVAF